MSAGLDSELRTLSQTDVNNASAVHDAALRMETLLLGESAYLSEDPTVKLGARVVRAANEVYETFETNLENEFAQQVLSGQAPLEDYPLYERFTRLVGNEVELAGITAHDRVLFIGSGPFPISPILTHIISGASVDCFDLSSEACETSRKVINTLGLSNKIRVFNITAEDTELPTVSTPGDIGKYDVVMLALLAQPKTKILPKIWGSLPKGSRVVFRNSEGNRRFIYEGANPEILPAEYQTEPSQVYHAGVDDTISGVVIKTDYQPWIWRI